MRFRNTPLGAAALALALSLPATAEETANRPVRARPVALATDSLRQPGFLFLELYTQDVKGYQAFLEAVAGYKAEKVEGNWATLVTERGEIMLNGVKDPGAMPEPFRGKLTGQGQGIGVEIGLVVEDLDKSYAEATKYRDKGWKITSGIVSRPWGVRDYRIVTPDGYYLRFTEPRK